MIFRILIACCAAFSLSASFLEREETLLDPVVQSRLLSPASKALWWQISASPDFLTYEIEGDENTIEDINAYAGKGFVRMRAADAEGWGEWTEAVRVGTFEKDAHILDGLIPNPRSPVKAYDQNVDPVIWEAVAPYLLPENHPIRARLDAIFTQARVLKDLFSVKAAGFETEGYRHFSRTLVANHPKMKGYIFKFYTDDQQINDFEKLLGRVKGAEAARASIANRGTAHIFKVPQKWLYPVPRVGLPGLYPKDFILIAEDMKVLKRHDNYTKWKSPAVTPAVLSAVYWLLQDAGLYDSAYAFNLPFSKDGKIAVIDTECYGGWPIPFYKLNKYLSPAMLKEWERLVQTGGY